MSPLVPAAELPNFQIKVESGTTCRDAVTAAGLPTRGPEAIVVVQAEDGGLRDLSWRPAELATVLPVPLNSEIGRSVLRHSVAHVLAQAVQDLYPEAKLGIGPPIDNGFYYDFLLPEALTPDDLRRIETRMRQIMKRGQRFERRVFSSAEEAMGELRNEPLKLELIERRTAADDVEGVEVGSGELSIYDNIEMNNGNVAWSDLCRGPHLPTTNLVGAFKLTRNAAAYWRGSEKNPQLQRIYGTAWETPAALDGYLEFLAEAERRDHRRVGRELELFHFDPTAPGMPYWLPRGLRLLNSLVSFWREEHEERGYQEISSPLINHRKLWDISGHWEHYRDDMFLLGSEESATYAVKPMNCPNAMVVYNLKTRSYRDLPFRLSDCDPLHRNELSGALHGLLRVQKFQQDDAHIFVRPDQIEAEYDRIFDICSRFYGIFGLEFSYRLGTRPEGYIGDVETWDRAEGTLERLLESRTDGKYSREDGGGAFYGPKIDILMKDVLGREWQMGTIQLDFQLPRRFGCEYTDSDASKQTPVVIHRVIYGSLERFLGIYIEHTGGAFPLWISPVTAVIIPISGEHTEYAQEIQAELRRVGANCEIDAREETLNSRIRSAQMIKAPMTLVIGSKEVSSRVISVRARGQRDSEIVPFNSFVEQVGSTLRERKDSIAFV